MSKVSIVIPAHNEVENIPVLLGKLIPSLEKYTETADFELVLVDDNSKDGTSSLIDQLAVDDPRIKAIHRMDTPGFGNAVRTGLKNASGDIIIPVMADMSDDPDDIRKLVGKINEGYDVAYGSRFCKGGYTDGYPWKKMIANRAYNNTVRLFFGIRQKDVTNAFKAYKKDVLDAIGIDNLEANGFDLTVEIPLKAHILGFSSVEVPVSWHERKKGEAKLKLSQNGHKYGKRLLKMFFMGNLISLRDMFGAFMKGSWVHLLLATVLGIVLLMGIFSLAGFSQIIQILSHISMGFVLVSCVMILMTFVFRTWRWSVLLRASGYRVHPDTAFKCIMFGWLVNYLLPLRIGDLARGVTLKTTEGTPLSVGLSTIVIERAMDMLTLAVILCVSLFFISSNSGLFEIAILALIVSIGLIVMLVILYKFDHIVIEKLGVRFSSLSNSIKAFKESLKSLSGNSQAIALSLLLSIPVWLFEVSSIYFSAKAVNFNLQPALAVLSGVIAFIAESIPTTPAGIGVHEGAIAGVLSLFNVSLSTGTSIALVDHFVRGLVIFSFGAVSAIHIGFESRRYFASLKKKILEPVKN